MIPSRSIEAPSKETPWDVPKARRCLKCKATFHSQWCGERVCSNCKRLSAWQNAAPSRSHTMAGHR